MQYVKIQNLEPKQVSNIINANNDGYKNLIDFTNYTETPHPRIKNYLVKTYEKFDESRVYTNHCNGNSIEAKEYDCVNFMSAYLYAYNNHKDVIFSVNDIWSMVTIMFSKYVNDNSEALRSKFVNHEGKRQLLIRELAVDVEQSLLMEKRWEYFFSCMPFWIKDNVKENVYEKLDNNFSVANGFDKLFSTCSIMSTLQTYFSFERCIMMCGITGVHFEGNLDDWNNLLAKIEGLREFALNNGDALSNYIDKIKIIINKFIETYNGNVDLAFWNNIVTIEQVRVGSGGQVQTYFDGWITHFLQVYQKVDINDIKNYKIKFPIKLENKFTRTIKDLTLYGGFSGISYDESLNAYKPQMSIVLYQQLAKATS